MSEEEKRPLTIGDLVGDIFGDKNIQKVEKKRDYAGDLAVIENTIKDLPFEVTEAWKYIRNTVIQYCKTMPYLLLKNEELKTQLSEAQAKKAGLREALEGALKWCPDCDGLDYYHVTGKQGNEPFETCAIKREILSAFSPAADRWKAMERVVDVAKHIKRVGGVISAAVMQELEESVDDLKALEKAGGE